MREQGFKKNSYWIKGECADDLKTLIRIINGTEGDHCAFLRRMIDEVSEAKA